MENNGDAFNIDLTIVIPVYNVEKYLPQCLDSIFNQSLNISDFEVIIVNDCSKGNCKEIIEEYKKKYYNIKLINHEYNKGLYQARRTGIFNSKGKYIMHVDGDDYLSFKENNKDFLKKAIDKLNSSNADILFFDCIHIDGEKEWKEQWFNPPNSLNGNKKIIGYFLDVSNVHTVCIKIYRKSILYLAYNDLPDINNISLLEDMFQNIFISYYAKSTITINQDFYCYRYLKDSNSRKLRKTKEEKESVIYQINSVLKAIDDFMESKLLYDKYGLLLALSLNDICYKSFCLYNEFQNSKESYNLYIKNKVEWCDKVIPSKMKKNLEESFLHNRDILIKKLTPYFFSIIIDKEYTVIKLFGIKIVLKNSKYVVEPKVISFSNILRFLFSIDVEKINKKTTVTLRLFGFRILLKR